MIPILYDSHETDFLTNGLGALADDVSCFVENEVNGAYELEMRYPVDGRRFADIQEQSLILAKPSPYAAPQPFRVYRITAPMRGTVTVYARHLAYDLMGIPLSPFKALTAPKAMQGLSGNAAVDCPFTFSTDKDTVADMTVSVPKSIWSQLGGSEGSILDVYGGEYEFNRFHVRLLKRLGADRGVTIRYGKNLTTLEQDKNCANVYTGVYPYWSGADGDLVMLPERILYAEGTFDHVRILPLDLSEAFEEKPSVEQLRARAYTYMRSNNIGVPDVSWTIGFVRLAQAEEYKDKAVLEEVHLGDTVTVIFPKMNVNASARVVKTRYDVLRDRYDSVTLGKVKANIADTIADNSQKILIESQKRQSEDGRLSSELSIQKDAIAAKVEKVGGAPESFGWELLIDSWTVMSNGVPVLTVNKDGIIVRGTIYGDDGYFKGTVRAGKILYGDENGTFSGEGLTGSTVTGSKIANRTVTGGNIGYGTISTTNTTSGINTSLGFANFSNDVFNGDDQADYMTLRNQLSIIGVFYMQGSIVNRARKKIMNSSGVAEEIRYLTWG